MVPIPIGDSTTPLTRAQKGPLRGLQARWDPYRTLDIYPNDPDFTCVGIAVYSNARCRWQFYDYSIVRAACAGLDTMAGKHPADVTRRDLELLAEKVLCSNHGKQMYTVVREWEEKIEGFLRESGRTLANMETVSNDRQPQRSQRSFEEELESVRRGMGDLRVERDGFQTRCTKSQEEVERLKAQQHQSLERSEQLQRVDKLLKKKVKESDSTIENMRKDARARLDEIGLLNKQLSESQELAAAKADEVQRLVGNLEDSTQNAERLEHAHSEQISELNKCLASRATELGKLEIANRKLQKSKVEDGRRILELEQQNQRMKSQKHASAFQNVVQRIVLQGKYERVARENITLKEQREGLSRQLEVVDSRVEKQEVSEMTFCQIHFGLNADQCNPHSSERYHRSSSKTSKAVYVGWLRQSHSGFLYGGFRRSVRLMCDIIGFLGYGLWSMVFGIWSMFYGLWYMV